MFTEQDNGLFTPHLGDDHRGIAQMAKVINPLMSIEARGRIAGIVYNTWHGISYVKAHSGPNQPNSAAQLVARSRLITIGSEWRALTQANRDAWTVYANAHPLSDWTGNPKRLTGQNWYIKVSVQLHRLGIASVDTPPVVGPPEAVAGLDLTLNVADIEAEWASPDAGTYYLDIWTLGPVSTGVDPKIEHATARALIVDNTAQPYVLVADAAPGRWRAWARVMNIENGLVSPWLSDILDIVP